eukprot:TRINITY_DN2093_c0_g1_i1.p1 TRINITY_DN2093_c0_g1~~TRINITY_DN2093_c0_g1_i1.p1  ORF type:complete len:111 (-),score=30.55 TRINITY_DN2093_c0_g1_i1:452-784(-)
MGGEKQRKQTKSINKEITAETKKKEKVQATPIDIIRSWDPAAKLSEDGNYVFINISRPNPNHDPNYAPTSAIDELRIIEGYNAPNIIWYGWVHLGALHEIVDEVQFYARL